MPPQQEPSQPLTAELHKFLAPELVYGAGARHYVAHYARNLSVRRLLVVSDEGVGRAGWTEQVTQALDEAGLEWVLYDQVTPNPKDYEVAEGAALFVVERCEAIVAVGGGSPIDCAKGIGIVAANGRPITEFEGVDQIELPMPPLICIPTTAGTGADISQFTIITDAEANQKLAIVSKNIIPDVSLTDPETTVTMDRALTAATGVDALAHAVEAAVSNASSSITDLHALEAIRLIFAHLPGALAEPQALAHRQGMMLASMHAGLAFSNASLGAVHALAHSLASCVECAHGELIAVLLPWVIDYNFAAARPAFERMGGVLGLPAEGLQERLVEGFRTLLGQAGLATCLGGQGLRAPMIPALARRAALDPCILTNPRRPAPGDLEAIYERVL